MKPNHICKLSTCQKPYYACNWCDRNHNWKSVACCREHYDLYVKEVLEARAREASIDLRPHRTDMTAAEVDAMMQRPVEEVLAETKEELKDYADDLGNVNILEAVDQINAENEAETKKKTRRKAKANS